MKVKGKEKLEKERRRVAGGGGTEIEAEEERRTKKRKTEYVDLYSKAITVVLSLCF